MTIRIQGTYNYFTQMADDVHFYGSKLLVCTDLKYPDGYTLDGKGLWSSGAWPESLQKCFRRKSIPEVIETFLQKIQEASADFGYDGIAMRVEMLLLSQCPYRWTRRLCFGNRSASPAVETLEAGTKALWQKLLLSGSSASAGEQPNGYVGGATGYTLEDTIEFAKCMEDVADILQLRECDMTKISS